MVTAHPGEHGNGDQRVTNAMIFSELKQLTKAMEDHARRDERIWETYGSRISALELGQTQRQTQIGRLEDDMKELRGVSKTWNIINSLGAVIAGVFAGLGWGK